MDDQREETREPPSILIKTEEPKFKMYIFIYYYIQYINS